MPSCHLLVTPFLVALLLAMVATAQQASGLIRGFDDQPVARVVVSAYAGGDQFAAQVLTDTDGRFALQCDRAITRLTAQLEGVRLELPLSNAIPVRASFAKEPRFQLRGHVVDPGGEFAVGVDLLLRDEHGKAIVNVTTDANGRFAVQLGQPVHEVIVDPLGWHHVEAGPIDRERGLVVDLRGERDRFFCVHGHVFDDAGRPAANAVVEARHDGRTLRRIAAASDGRYRLWTNRPIDELHAQVGAPLAQRRGLWVGDATVDLDAREHGFVLVTGRVVGPDGQGVSRASLVPLDARIAPPRNARSIGSTDREGNFRVLLPKQTAFLYARGNLGRQGFAAAPFGDAKVELQIGR